MHRYSNPAVRGAWTLVVAALFCVLPAQGQVIPEEGFPTKPVFSEESTVAPGLHEECGPFLTSGEFGEECTGDIAGDNGGNNGGNNGPGAVGIGAEGGGLSSDALDPVWRTPPRLECPSAVFLEELETGAIDCHAWDAAGAEHLAYRWEPIGGATQNYLENPRLIPEDAPNPAVVAPASPQYDTLESFLSEEGAQRYRYRLTATSRATGLSSWSEVDVFVWSIRPGVYCPLELEVEEGGTVALACEGADPLSFRMDDGDDAGESPALWEWKGLWGASTAPLTAADTPAPLFTAPEGSAGRTYHYVASMTTRSSGVARTARRKVSVTVAAGEEAGFGTGVSPSMGNAAPVIKCTPIDRYVVDHLHTLDIDCSVTPVAEVPSDAVYSWAALSPADGMDRLVAGADSLTPTFEINYDLLPSSGSIEYKYEVTLSGTGIADAIGTLTVTLRIRASARRMDCVSYYHEVYTGEDDFSLDCKPADGTSTGVHWVMGYSPGAAALVYNPDDETKRGGPEVRRPEFDYKFDVPEALPGNETIRYYTYLICMYIGGDSGYTDSRQVTVAVRQKPTIHLMCLPEYDKVDTDPDFPIECKASAVGVVGTPTFKYEWIQTNLDHDPSNELSATNIEQPMFEMTKLPDLEGFRFYDYELTVSIPAIRAADPKTAKVRVLVDDAPMPEVIVTCPGNPYEYFEGAYRDLLSKCTHRTEDIPSASEGTTYTHAWTDLDPAQDLMRLRNRDQKRPLFYPQSNVNADTTYKYRYTVTATHPSTGPVVGFADIEVIIKDTPSLDLSCTDPDPVYEGDPPFILLGCKYTGAPPRPLWPTFDWASKTPNGDHLLSTTSESCFHCTHPPTFTPPPAVQGDTDYAYDITVRTNTGEMATDAITVTVLKEPQIVVDCPDHPYTKYEGAADFSLNCTAMGAHDPSTYAYAWTARSSATNLSLLDNTDVLEPTFMTPTSVTADETHEYLLTVSADNAVDGTFNVDVNVLKEPPIVIDCPGHPYSVYEGVAAFPLNCTATGAPDPATEAYAWTARSSTTDMSLLNDAAVSSPTFDVPGNVDADETHEYLLTVSADNAVTETFAVDVEVRNKATLALDCTDPAAVYEGDPDIPLDCAPSAQPGLPAGSSYTYSWAWLGVGADPNLLVAGAVGAPPTFETPLDVNGDQTYEYRLTLSADHSDAATEDVTITVLDKPVVVVDCTDPAPVYEGADDFALACTATGAPPGSTPVYAWTARTSDTDLGLLSDPAALSPTFEVPGEVTANETHEYTLTVTADNAEPGSANVTVEVLDKPQIVVACTDPDPVYEGAVDFALDCTAPGAPAGSAPVYEWTAQTSDTDLDLLSDPAVPSPTFMVPGNVDANKTHEYTLTVSADNAETGTDNITVRVLNEGAISLVCPDPDPVYEGSGDITLNCTESNVPAGSTPVYEWSPRGATENTDRLSETNSSSPTFYVPDTVDGDETYAYTVTATANNAEAGTAYVTVEVLEKPDIVVACTAPDPVYEGADNFALDCTPSNAPGVSGGAPKYTYAWTARGSTPDTDLLRPSNVASPMFLVPDEVLQTTTYEYLLTVSASNADPGMDEVSVTVRKKGDLMLACANPSPVYEGSGGLTLNCMASGGPDDSVYEYAWEAQGATPDDLLSASEGASPTFSVPEDVPRTTEYKYLVTASAENAVDKTAEVTVTVLDKEALSLACADPPEVYEGSPDLMLSCSAMGAPEGSNYEYAWSARGSTPDTDLLVAGEDGPTPTFTVPGDVPQTTRYEYLLTVSAENAVDATEEVTVTVLDSGVLTLTCANPAPVYEGSGDLPLNCTALGGPDGSVYNYVWAAQGATPNDRLSAVDIASPTFYVPAEVDADETYEYRVTVSAENAVDATAKVTVTVLNKPDLALACVNPAAVYEGSEDITLNCTATDAPGGPDGSAYEYIWAARGATVDTDLLSAADVASPTFYVPAEVDADETYEYLVTVSAENAEDAMAEVTVTVLNKEALVLACTDPAAVYEGSPDITLDCSTSGAPDGSDYTYVWAAHGATTDADLLSAADIASPTFYVPAEVDADETYEYLVTVSAEHADPAMAEVTVTVLDKEALALACTDPAAVYEGSPDITLACAASGAPDGSSYTYAWEGRGATLDTDRLVAGMDGPTPTFDVPEEVDADETYEYLLTVSAEHAEDAMAEVTVTVLDRIEEVSFSVDALGLGVHVGASPLRFGVQSSDTQVTLDALTDRISTSVSGPYHVGRMTLAPGADLVLDETREITLSIEMASPVVLEHESADSTLLALSPSWSMAESCEQLSSQSIRGLYTEARLSGADCHMLLFGGALDLSGAPTGRYSGTIDVTLRTGAGEETHHVPVEVIVAPAQRVITIGPGGVRFDTSREVPAGLTAEQNVSIYPDVAYLTREAPSGAFELSNPSLIPLEVSVSAIFGYTEATEAGQERVVEDPAVSRLGDLSELVNIYPQSLVLLPGEQGVVRYGVREEALAEMTEAGYAAFFDVASSPRQYVRADQLPEEATGEKTARVTMRVPGAYAAEAGASSLRAELLSVSQGAALSATFLVETEDAPFLGEVVAYDGDGRELGRRRTLVYTRSRVRISLDRLPEGEAVFLRFAPSGSGRVSEPVSIPWNAPRSIGAAPDSNTSPASAVLAN